MSLSDDGDFIRGLGFVALYAAYIEEAIDECLKIMLCLDLDKYVRLSRQPTSKKIQILQDYMAALSPPPQELLGFSETLSVVNGLLDERNQVIHGRVYAIPGEGDIRRSGRIGVPEQPATSAELYTLANALISFCQPLNHASIFALPRLLNGR